MSTVIKSHINSWEGTRLILLQDGKVRVEVELAHNSAKLGQTKPLVPSMIYEKHYTAIACP